MTDFCVLCCLLSYNVIVEHYSGDEGQDVVLSRNREFQPSSDDWDWDSHGVSWSSVRTHKENRRQTVRGSILHLHRFRNIQVIA